MRWMLVFAALVAAAPAIAQTPVQHGLFDAPPGGRAGSDVAVVISPIVTRCTDYPSTITAGGTSQVALSANPNRVSWWLQNPANGAELLYFNASATVPAATTSSELAVGASFSQPAGTVTVDNINVLGATTGHPYKITECVRR